MPLCRPNMTITGRVAPTNRAGAQAALVLRKVKNEPR
ncbi:hypothetical protein AHiyo8_09960 [Arthrobacter sp. Hiyo8]|nr:hypothetical protein AHiyo8_09960 [Arthrobacter sp. Hiyo8]